MTDLRVEKLLCARRAGGVGWCILALVGPVAFLRVRSNFSGPIHDTEPSKEPGRGLEGEVHTCKHFWHVTFAALDPVDAGRLAFRPAKCMLPLPSIPIVKAAQAECGGVHWLCTAHATSRHKACPSPAHSLEPRVLLRCILELLSDRSGRPSASQVHKVMVVTKLVGSCQQLLQHTALCTHTVNGGMEDESWTWTVTAGT